MMDTITDGTLGSKKLSRLFSILRNLQIDFLHEAQLHKFSSYALDQIWTELMKLPSKVVHEPGDTNRLCESAIKMDICRSKLVNFHFDDSLKIKCNALFEEKSFVLLQRYESDEISKQSLLDFPKKDIFSKLYSLSCDFQINSNMTALSNQKSCFGFYQTIQHRELNLEKILQMEIPQTDFHLIAESESLKSIDETVSETTENTENNDTENESNLASDDENDCRRGDTEVFSFIGKNLSVEDFKEMHFHLDMDSLLEVEYLVEDENEWKFMLERKEHDIICNLCNCTLAANTPTIATHLRGKNHCNILKGISTLYHPTYCAWSDDEESDDFEIAASAFYRSRALKEDMTLADFKKSYTDMDMYNLLEILYLKDNIWINMFEEKHYLYLCNLCDEYQLANFYEVQSHIRGLHHNSKLSLLKALYHPIYLKNAICNVEPPDRNSNSVEFNSKNDMVVDHKTQTIKNSQFSNECHQERGDLKIASKNNINGKDKPLTLNLFKIKYLSLEIDSLLKVQYSMNFKQKKLMIVYKGLLYFCNLCNDACLGNESNVKVHIRGASHSKKVESIVEMYDPKNCIWLKNKQTGKSLSINSVNATKQQNITAQNFRSQYINLGIGNLLKIKYKLLNSSRKWSRMIICDSSYFGRFICILCDSIMLKNGEQLRNHIRNIYHINKVSNIFDMCHPKYCPEGLNLKGVQKGVKSEANLKSSNKSNNKTEKKMDIHEFKQTYIKLRLDKLMRVQYQLSNNKWEFMLHEENQRFFCNLCGNVPLGTEFNIKSHIRGRYHSSQVRDLLGLHHPDIFPAAYNKKEEESQISNEESDSELEHFKESYVELEIDELLDIEYRQNDNDWEYMLTELNEQYFCNLCGKVCLGNIHNVEIHIRGRFHSEKVKHLTDLHHPRYLHFSDGEESDDDDEASGESGEETDSILEQFKTTYVDLEICELLEVWYQQNDNDWECMLSEWNERYFCNLCGKVSLGTTHNVKIHIRGRSHSEKVKNLKGLYHPIHCYFSDSEDSEEEEEPSERFSDESDSVLQEFKQTYVDLAIDELLEIEYQEDDNEWKFMLTENYDRYFCNLCGNVSLGTTHNVEIHIRGRTHSEKVENLVSLYHPGYCCFEYDEDPQEDEESSQLPSDLYSELEEFKKTYIELEIDELLDIEYLHDRGWEYMLTEFNERYSCNLCGKVQLGTVHNVRQHIRGGFHSHKIKNVEDLYHPKFCSVEDDEGSEEDEEASHISSEDFDSNLEEFKTTYVELDIDELLDIEYQQNGNDWEYMLSEFNERYSCNLCGKVQLGTAHNVRQHIRGGIHSHNVKNLTDLYHPKY